MNEWILIMLKSRKKIAQELGISDRTLRRKLSALKIELPAGLLCPSDQKLIYNILNHSTVDMSPADSGRSIPPEDQQLYGGVFH